MALELYVWGPAFGFDSVDPECLAAISLFRYAIPRGSWKVIAANDPSISPHHVLPALKHRGTWTSSGFADIVSYLKKSTDYPIDVKVELRHKADQLSCASYLTTHGSGLIALSLYVSPSAWTEITRPAYSSLLHFPLTWVIPPALRAAALEKAEHLGIGQLAAEVGAGIEAPTGTAETTSTGFLRLRQTLGPSKTLQPEQATAVRFHHLASEFYRVLEEFLGVVHGGEQASQDWSTSSPTSTAFLAYAYLSLMRVRTPYPLLKTVIEKEHPNLISFLRTTGEALAVSGELPWQRPDDKGFVGTMERFASGVIESTPGIGESWVKWRRGGVKTLGDDSVNDPSQVVLAVSSAFVGLVAVGAAVLFKSLSPFGASTHQFELDRDDDVNTPGLQRFGEIGAVLDGLPVWEQQRPKAGTRHTIYHQGDADVSVDIENSTTLIISR